jgi:hypothetical protein
MAKIAELWVCWSMSQEAFNCQNLPIWWTNLSLWNFFEKSPANKFN